MKWIGLFLLAELLSIILLSSVIGALGTIGLLALGIIFGFLLLVLNNALTIPLEIWRKQTMVDYAAESISMFLRVCAAILLMLPGFISDGLAIVCILVPGDMVLAHIARRHHAHNHAHHGNETTAGRTSNTKRIIDVDFTKE